MVEHRLDQATVPNRERDGPFLKDRFIDIPIFDRHCAAEREFLQQIARHVARRRRQVGLGVQEIAREELRAFFFGFFTRCFLRLLPEPSQTGAAVNVTPMNFSSFVLGGIDAD